MFIPVKDVEFNEAIKTAIECEPVMDFNPDSDAADVQKIDKNTGFPVWSVQCVYRHAEDFGNDFLTVKLPYKSNPNITAAPINFGGLKIRTWDMGGKKGLSVSADSFTQDIRPAVPSAPPKPPADKK